MTRGSKAMALDDLVALNDEIVALVRAGLPLDRGLLDFGRDAPGRLGQIAADVGQRLSAGQSLAQALEGDSSRIPPVYRAVVEAGLAAGRLPAALESMAESTRRLAALRRTVGLALVYPLGVVLVGYCLLLWMLSTVLPRIATAFADIGSPAASFLTWMTDTGGGPLVVWWWLVPVVVVLLPLAWWWWTGRGMLVEPATAGRMLGWTPWFGQLLQLSQAATFAETLAVLIENRLPLGRAVLLSADATGSAAWRSLAHQFSQSCERGEPWSPLRLPAGFPPLLCWLLGAQAPHANLPVTLRHVAADYRQRAQYRAEVIHTLVPVALTIGVGGTAVLAYALLLVAPWAATLEHMAAP